MKINLLVTSFALSLLYGCGGGGGDGRDATNVSGTWRGALTKVSDTCIAKSPSSITVSHQVSQNEDAVILTAESGVQFLGNTVGENGFSVDATHSTIGAASCSDQTQISYDSINDDADPTADIDLQINRNCQDASSCSIQYIGALTRSVNSTPTSTNTPTSTTSNGGCYQMNTKPAAGSFSGNGGCGISDAVFSIQGDSVVLNPFGANQATSFSISSSNSSSASSQSTDLTIQGSSGYSCSMVCAPPSTFTVQCVKQGGATCVEKF